MDVIKEVAELKCQGCMSGNCPNAVWYIRTGDVDVGCGGSGLRYRTLSQECPRHGSKEGGFYQCGDSQWDKNCAHRTGCNGSGRILDVTLEKVMLCLRVDAITNISFRVGVMENNILCTVETYPAPRVMRAGDTDLLAACATLLVI